MISVYQLKPAFQNLLRPMVGQLAAWGISANAVTLFACLLAIATGIWLVLHPSGWWWLLPVVLLLRMALNAADGMLAREFHMKSNLGAILNEITDVIGDAATYLPFCILPGLHPGLVLSAIWLAALSEMTGVIAVQIGASRRYDGPMGKSDRATIFGILAVILACGVAPGPWLQWPLWLVNITLVLTIVNRARAALKEVDHA